jgi:hypothetical protein
MTAFVPKCSCELAAGRLEVFQFSCRSRCAQLPTSTWQPEAAGPNLCHEQVLTTFTSYGAVPSHGKTALIRGNAPKFDGGCLDDGPAETEKVRLARLETLAKVGEAD